MSVNEAASLCDHHFEAAQRALASGDFAAFQALARIHTAYAELFCHLRHGGLIH